GSTVQVALADAMDPSKVDELGYAVGKEIQVVVADAAAIENAISRHYGDEDEDVADIMRDLSSDEKLAQEVQEAAAGAFDVNDLANEAPIVRFVNLVMFQAIKDRASDIHFEPFEDEFKIR